VGNAPAGRGKRGKVDGGPQTFRSTTAIMVWWVWLLFFAANMVDLAVQGHDHASAVAAAILVLGTGVAYVCAQRPRVVADDAGVTIRNPLRDYRIGWSGVTEVDLADLLRVHCAWDSQQDGKRHTKIISAWAVHYSRRRKLVAENRARRASQPRSSRALSRGSLGSAPPHAASTAAEQEAEKALRVLSERATAAQAESVWAAGTVPISGSRAPKAAKSAKAPKGTKPVTGTEAAAALAADTATATASANGTGAATGSANGTSAATASANGTSAATASANGTSAATGSVNGTGSVTATGSANRPGAATAAGTTATASDAITGARYSADPAASLGLAGAGWLEPLRSTWNTTALAAIIIPALIVILVILL
jgi:PH (Pleckstrin Homology) domain-containing protein